MLSATAVPRISTLLDEAKEQIEEIAKRPTTGPQVQGLAQAYNKIDEAQRLLLGDPATDPRDN